MKHLRSQDTRKSAPNTRFYSDLAKMAPKPASTAGKAPASTASKAPAKTTTESAAKGAKKTAKAASGGAGGEGGEKKKRRKGRKETYSSYIYKGESHFRVSKTRMVKYAMRCGHVDGLSVGSDSG